MKPSRKAVRKRSLPIGVRHTRHQVTLPPAHVKRLRGRVAAARAAGDNGASLSGEIARCVDEADGNLRSMRHALRQPLNLMRMQVEILKQKLAAGELVGLSDLHAFDAAVQKIVLRLEPPASGI